MSNENSFYRISDLALIVTISIFHPIEDVDKTNPRRVFFVFKKNKALDELIDKYWRQELRVDPQRFFAQLKIVKSRIYEHR